MNIKITTAALILLTVSNHLHSYENQIVEESEFELMQKLELELLDLIQWECSDDNPSLGKFDNLDCNVKDNNQNN